jgi:hypothetical protein
VSFGFIALFLFLLTFGLMVWTWAIEPWWEARDLYRAADEARSRPYVEDAEVDLDWFDGSSLAVRLTQDATAADAQELWCEVLLDADGGGIEVYRGYDDSFGSPKRKECARLEPAP